MFTDHPLTPEIERDIAGTPSAEAIRRVFRDYATLLQSAERDRQALIGFVDNLDARLDEIPPRDWLTQEPGKQLWIHPWDLGSLWWGAISNPPRGLGKILKRLEFDEAEAAIPYSRKEADTLLAWARTIPGWNDSHPPFKVSLTYMRSSVLGA